MAEGTSSEIKAQFTDAPTGGAVATCCNNVKGEFEKAPGAVTAPDVFVDGIPQPIGNPQFKPTYYFDTGIPKGVSASYKFRYKFSLRGTLVCKCLDDGRILSRAPFNEQVTMDIQTWIGSTDLVSPKRLAPWAMVLGLAYDAYKIGRRAYDIYNLTPDKLKELAGPAMEKALEKARNSATALCKRKHKPCSDPKPEEPAKPPEVKPVPTVPGDGEGIPMS